MTGVQTCALPISTRRVWHDDPDWPVRIGRLSKAVRADERERCGAGEQMTARQSRIDHLIHSLTVMMLVANADGVCKRKPTPNAEKPPPPLNAHRSATAASSRCLAELRRGKRSAAPRIIGKPVPSDRRCGNDAIDGRGSAGRSAESFPEAALNQTDET